MTTPNEPRPGTGARIDVRTDRHLIRARARTERHLLVEVVAPTVERDPSRLRPPVNLAFVLDRSGSMGGQDKLSLAKQAVMESIHRLDDEDRFSVVVYDSEIDVVLPAGHAGGDARRLAAERLRPVQPRGSTALHGGWVTGCNEVAGGLGQGVNRVLLLTDGLANVGIQDPGELGRQAQELRVRGITTSTFGVGRDFDEHLLQAMADNGGGNFYFIGDLAQMRDHITSEVGDTLEVVARDVVLELDVPVGVEVAALSAFRAERHGRILKVHLGDLVSGQVVQVALVARFDIGVIGTTVEALVSVRDREGVLRASGGADAPVSVAWTYDTDEGNEAQVHDAEVERLGLRMQAEQGRVTASRLNKQGRYVEAATVLQASEAYLAPAAAYDPEVAALRMELAADVDTFSAPMDAFELKRRHFAASSATRARRADGKPVKSTGGQGEGGGTA
jgi:Ca-activated chloride channel homolog